MFCRSVWGGERFSNIAKEWQGQGCNGSDLDVCWGAMRQGAVKGGVKGCNVVSRD